MSDNSIRRCTGCGQWLWRDRPCTACAELLDQEVSAA